MSSNLSSLRQDIWTPATQQAIASALASLSSLPSRGVGDAVLDAGVYYLSLDGVTRFSLVEAVKAISRGSLGHTFFPSPVEMRLQCDKVMEPHFAARRREAQREQQRRENAEWARTRQSITPEGRARVRELHETFTAQHTASKQSEPARGPMLDPELVATIPDRPAPRLGPDNGGL